MGYEPLTAAMDALASCTPQYNGEQAQAVAKLLSQWHAKWTQESELHGKAIDRIAALEQELAEARSNHAERNLRWASELSAAHGDNGPAFARGRAIGEQECDLREALEKLDAHARGYAVMNNAWVQDYISQALAGGEAEGELSSSEERRNRRKYGIACPSCGYTQRDVDLHGDHHLCKEPWPPVAEEPADD